MVCHCSVPDVFPQPDTAIFHPAGDDAALLLLLARSTDKEMARMLDYLKTENRILRSKLPKRGEGTWDEFIRIHAKTLWASDFISKKVWTLGGLVDFFILFFIHVDTRKVHVAGITATPDGGWMAQQARNMCMFFDDWSDKPQYIVCDKDTKSTQQFEAILKSNDIELKRTAVRAPNQNAYAERFAQTLQQECLDHFIILGKRTPLP